MGASMIPHGCEAIIPHRILLEALKRLMHAIEVTPNAAKRRELAGSRGGRVYLAGTVGGCRAPRQRRAFSSSARRARVVPKRGLELPFHARETIWVVAIVSSLREGRGFEGRRVLQ